MSQNKNQLSRDTRMANQDKVRPSNPFEQRNLPVMHQMPDGTWMVGATHQEEEYVPQYDEGGTVSEIWEQKTGTPWSQAKAQGLTSGSYEDNVNLLNQLNSGQFSQSSPATERVNRNGYDEETAKIQEKLVKAGYELGDYGDNGVDGIMGDMTRNALRNYNQHIDPEQANLEQVDIQNKKETEKLQTMLVNKGYNIGKLGIDGDLGPDTTKAMQAYEKGIPVEEFNSQLSSEDQAALPQVQQEAQMRKAITEKKELEENVITEPTVKSRVKGKEKEVKEEAREAVKTGQGDWEDAGGERVYKTKLDYKALTEDEVPTPTEKDYENALSIYDDLFMGLDVDQIRNDGRKVYKEPKSLEGRIKALTDLSRDEKKVLQCAASALNCESEFVSGRLGLDSARESIQATGNIRNTPYSLPSKNPHKGDDYHHNASYDSWEIADALLHSKKGFEVYNRDTHSEADINYGNLALGSLVLWGGADDAMGDPSAAANMDLGQRYTPKGAKNKANHTTSIIGFDKEDGHPLIYDYGKVKRLEDAVRKHPHGYVRNIVTPNQFKGYSYNNLNYLKNERDQKLGITDFQKEKQETYREMGETPAQNTVNSVYNATDQLIPDMARRYGVNVNVLKDLQKRVVGIGIQETNLGNKGPREEWSLTSLGTNPDDAVKPHRSFDIEYGDDPDLIKAKSYLKETLSSEKASDPNSKTGWQIEIKAQKLIANGDTRDRKEIEADLRSKYPERESKYSKAPSIGPYKIKNYPKYLTEVYGTTKDDLRKIKDKDKSIAEGSKVALAHMIENYQMMKKKNPNKYSHEELVDLATIGYNSKSKLKNDDYYKYYIKDKVLEDDYIKKVKAYSTLVDAGALKKSGTYGEPTVTAPAQRAAVAESTSTNRNAPAVDPNAWVPSENPFAQPSIQDTARGVGWGLEPTVFDQGSFKEGGEYYDAELNDAEIEELKRLGYRIEEL